MNKELTQRRQREGRRECSPSEDEEGGGGEEGREGRCVGARPPLVPGDKGAALPECPTRKRTSDCSLFLLLSYSLLILPFVCFLFFFLLFILRMGNYWQACNFLQLWKIFFEGGNRFFLPNLRTELAVGFQCMQCKC